jgi:hypothetical protein
MDVSDEYSSLRMDLMFSGGLQPVAEIVPNISGRSREDA